MSDHDLIRRSVEELTAGLSVKRWSSAEIAEAYIARSEEVEPEVAAFLSRDFDRVRERANEIDRSIARGDRPGSLCGIPIAVKDNLSTVGWTTTCASRILERFRPTYTATAVRRMEEAGAVLFGKANLDEFGFGSSTENSSYGPTRNPWDRSRVPGGSSGGSAAAVAAGASALALGSDTGGSVRQPASFCGLVGLKPHYGHVSRYGLVAFASSLDVVGPIGRTARDTAILFNAIQGEDPFDATSLPGDCRIEMEAFDREIRGARIGVSRNWCSEGVDPDVSRTLEETAERFRALGAVVEDADLRAPQEVVATYYVLADAEASANLARFDGVRYGHRSDKSQSIRSLYEESRGEGFGLEVKRRILLGTFVLSSGYYDAYYAQAQKVRAKIKEGFESTLAQFDAILMPTAPAPAFRLGEKREDPLAMYLSDVFTLPANLIRNPAISFPAGKSGEGLPIGMQLYGRKHDERTLLRLVDAHESVFDGSGSSLDPDGPLVSSLVGGAQ